MKLPRPYQGSLIDSLRSVMPRIKTIVLQLCTGGGKTNLAAWMIRSAMDKGSLVFFIVHRRDLLFQTSNTFTEYGIPHSFIAAKKHFNPFSKVYLCSIETLKRRLDKSPIPKIIFVDECHLSASAGWSKVIEFYRSRGCWIIGLSATPWRLDGRSLGDLFQHIVCGPSMRELINQGYLSDYKYYAPDLPDFSGDKSETAKEAAVEKNNILIGHAVTHYKKYAHGKRAVVYASSIKHSKKTVEEFCAAGIPAEHMDGDTPEAERRAITQRFATGVTWVLSNKDLITTGYDLQSQSGLPVTIEAIILLRYTDSLSLFLQMVGRGLRPKDEPALIFDHSGCAMKSDGTPHHGMPADDRVWTLEGREKESRNVGERAVPIMQCKFCYYCSRPFLHCPNCGREREIQERKIDQREGELVELSKDQIRQIERKKQGMARSLDEMIAEGYRRGYKPGKCEAWAAHVISARNAR